jgi:heptose I phosphotransferase
MLYLREDFKQAWLQARAESKAETSAGYGADVAAQVIAESAAQAVAKHSKKGSPKGAAKKPGSTATDNAVGDLFEQIMQLQGKEFRNVKTRRTLQFTLQGRSYFVKIHRGIGWYEVIKDLLQLRRPIVGAENEWLAIQRLTELGIDTMTIVAYGTRGKNPASMQSFIVTEDLINTVSLEYYCAGWPTNKPPFALKLKLLNKIADVSRTLHSHGIGHRDYYICHFLLQKSAEGQVDVNAEPHLSLIDLHRTLINPQLPQRWIIKDIAGLYFSAMHIGLTHIDLLRFVKRYSNKPLRTALSEDKNFWQAVNERAVKLDKKVNPELHRSAREDA